MRKAILVGVMAVTGLVVTQARADIPPPNTSGCQSKVAGAACTDDGGAAGTCLAETCSRLDYANWNQDAQSSPPTTTYDCLICGTAAAPDATAIGTDAAPPTTGTPQTTSGSSSCSGGPQGLVGGALALLLALAGLAVARRKG